ncbi:mechanosensitive ion channel family protein [Sulfurovum mangrovi]|uniref:mechanosensitive ion channel family protein n=1 Tax=Sulfurovum mangrovi TaxID=2893889 RepID=UPI001E545D69|nr:mechanosensitive ion channel domain-containing protein [Sulfurovum mangrovi]UFH60348.1 mechanosensitive ion channel [Sulfurovum mangrovi]
MRTVLSLFLILFSLLSASDVDKRFFVPESKERYLTQMEANITADPDRESATLESALLTQIRSQDQKTVQIDYQRENLDPKRQVDPKAFEKSIDRYIEAKQTLDQSRKKVEQLRSKLEYVKKHIKDITEENRDKLRTYQLQYTLYRQLLEYESNKITMLDEVIKFNESLFASILPVLGTDGYETGLSRIKKNLLTLDELQSKIAALDVKIEHERLLESKEVETLLVERKALEEKLNSASIITAESMLDSALFELALKKDNSFYDALKRSAEVIASVTSSEKDGLQRHLQLLRSLGKTYFGVTSVAVITSKESLIDTLNYFISLLYKPLFVFNEKAVNSADILKVVLIFVIGTFIAALYRRRVVRWSSGWGKATPMTTKLIANFGYYFIIVVTFFVAINSVGIDLTSFSMFASALAIGIGFGLQTVVSNMVSGIIMMFERSVRVGDFIELSDTLRGTVTDMRIRSTVIKTLDNIDIVVPNSSFIQNNVINLTLDDTMRRLHIPFGVAYGTEVERVKEAVLSELAQSGLTYYRGENEERQPMIRMTGMGASSVDYELLVWIDWDTQRKNATMSDFLILVYKALYKHSIEIPFPQMDLHVKNINQTRVDI